MPEGDTLYLTAARLRKALLGRTITRFESTVDAVRAVDDRTPVAGRTVAAVEPRAKHLLITLAPPEGTAGRALVLHTHMRMTGSWHLYRPGEPWQKPARRAVAVLHTTEFVAPCFSAPVVELLTEWQARGDPRLVSLGPDAITPGFDREEARRRLRRHPEMPIGVALLNQRLMSGVGNIYKSEVLFMQRISPFRPVGDLTEGELEGLVEESHRLLRLNREEGLRRTRPSLNERQRLWVYGRGGQPCHRCGEAIRMRRQGADARSTYYCPRCQAAESDP